MGKDFLNEKKRGVGEGTKRARKPVLLRHVTKKTAASKNVRGMDIMIMRQTRNIKWEGANSGFTSCKEFRVS